MLTIGSIAQMNKGALRAACRDKGIQYGKLDIAGMRAALAEHATPEAPVAEVPTDVETGTANNPGSEGMLDPNLDAGGDAAIAQAQVPAVAPVAVVPVTPAGPRASSKGIKIQKDRPTQNGVKMPSEGSVCRAVWDYLQNEVDHGRPVTAASVKAHAATVAWNPNNASIEFYNWRKFNGIQGRSPTVAPTTVPVS